MPFPGRRGLLGLGFAIPSLARAQSQDWPRQTVRYINL